MTVTTDPAALALIDQAAAAARHAFTAFLAAADTHADYLTHRVPAGAALAVLQRLHDGLTDGTTTLCQHATPRTPMPMFWVPWRPGKVRCANCARRVLLAIKGTREDKRCDACHHIRSSVISISTQLPAIVWPDTLRALGPVGVTFGLCRACRTTT